MNEDDYEEVSEDEYFDHEYFGASDEPVENPEDQTVEVIVELRAGHRKLKLTSVQVGSGPQVHSSQRFGLDEDEARLFCVNWINLVLRKVGDVMENYTPENIFGLCGAEHLMDLASHFLGDAFRIISEEEEINI